MKIVHINVSDRHGGAALAVWRLHHGLLKHDIDSHLLVRHQYSTAPTVTAINLDVEDEDQRQSYDIIQRVYYHKRTDMSNTHFSLPLESLDLSQHPLVREADIIHLHWVASFVTPETIRTLLTLNKPVVWTLHDMAPFTGGCHFSAGCHQYQSACTACPQYLTDPFDIPHHVLLAKKACWSHSHFMLIAPSRWIGECARESIIFGSSSSIEVIPNGIDSQLFQPSSQAMARTALGLSLEGRYILCGSDQSQEKRKGFAMLSQVLKTCFTHSALSETTILWVGDSPPDGLFAGLPLKMLGRISDENKMVQAYVASDIFILPSIEDNLPNMMLEALSCGTPVVAVDVGGIAEIMTHGREGYLSKLGDEEAMVNNIISLLSTPELLKSMSVHARNRIEDAFSAKIIAEKHLRLYQQALGRSREFVPGEKYDLLNQLLPKITLHCLTTEIDNLQTQLQALQVEYRARMNDLDQLRTQNDYFHRLLRDQNQKPSILSKIKKLFCS